MKITAEKIKRFNETAVIPENGILTDEKGRQFKIENWRTRDIGHEENPKVVCELTLVTPTSSHL